MAPDRSRRRTTTPDSAAAAAAASPPPALSQRRSTRSTSAAALSPARAPPPPARSRGTTPVPATGGGGGPVKELRRGRSRGPSVPPVEEHVPNELRRPPLRTRKSGSRGGAAATTSKAARNDDGGTPEPHPLSRHVSPDIPAAQEQERDDGLRPGALPVDAVGDSSSTLTGVGEPAIPAVTVSSTSDHAQAPVHAEVAEEQVSSDSSTSAAAAAGADPVSDLFVSNMPPSPSIQATVGVDTVASSSVPDALSETISGEQNRVKDAAATQPRPDPEVSVSGTDTNMPLDDPGIPVSAVNLDGVAEGAEAPPREMQVDSAAAAEPASPVTEPASLLGTSTSDAATVPIIPSRDDMADQILEKAEEEEEVRVEPESAKQADADMRDGTLSEDARTGDFEEEKEVEQDPGVPEKVDSDDEPVVSESTSLSVPARNEAAPSSSTTSGGAELLPPVSVSQAVRTVGPAPELAAETDVAHKEEEEEAAATSIDEKSGGEHGVVVETGVDPHANADGGDSSAVAVDAPPPPAPQAAAEVDAVPSAPEPIVVAPVPEFGIDKLAPVDNESAIADPNAATDGSQKEQQQLTAVENEATESLFVNAESTVDGDVSPAEPPSAPSVASATATAAARKATIDPGVSKPLAESEPESTRAPSVQVEPSTLLPPPMTSDEAVAQATTATKEATPPPRQTDAEPETANEQLSAPAPLATEAESVESAKHVEATSSETAVVEQATVPAPATSGPISEAVGAPTPVSTAVAAAAAEAAPSKGTTSESPSSTPTTRANGSSSAVGAPPVKRTPPLPAGGITMPPALQTMTPKDVRKRFNTHKIACVQTLNVQLIT